MKESDSRKINKDDDKAIERWNRIGAENLPNTQGLVGKGSKTAGGMNVWESFGTGKRETGGEGDEDRIEREEREERREEERRVKLRRRVEMEKKREKERMRERKYLRESERE